MHFLDFEQPIAELDAKIKALGEVSCDTIADLDEELTRLHAKNRQLTEKIFQNLTDWQIIQLARHPERPYTLDYLRHTFDNVDELHGDRSFGDDKAIIGALAMLGDQSVMVIGQQKGRSTKEKLARNFGMPHPEGYRKALRLMKLAEQFNIPIITLIDTAGAYPGVNAEARGQAEAIARNLQEMSTLRVPIIAVVIGEGCSGGALGIGVADHIIMLEYSYFATISPEGCASILWKNAEQAPKAAQIMGITARRLEELKIIDEVIEEPLGGAHRDPEAAAHALRDRLIDVLGTLQASSREDLLEKRYERLLAIGTQAA